MTKTIIADSSPLIVLLKCDLEFILPGLFEEVLVPETVWQEIMAGGSQDRACQKLPEIAWLKRIHFRGEDKKLETYNLGKGETDALMLAFETPESVVILDDYAARKCAGEFQIPFVGTGGLLIIAKRKGLIPSVSEALDRVQDEGLWISEDLIKLLKRKAGE